LIPQIYHLADAADVEKLAKTGRYSAPSLDSEGFIHCCSSTQLPGVIQRYYIDAEQLVLLYINPNLLDKELVLENTVGGTELFPHIYGDIIHDAIEKHVALDVEDIAQIAASDEYTP